MIWLARWFTVCVVVACVVVIVWALVAGGTGCYTRTCTPYPRPVFL